MKDNEKLYKVVRFFDNKALHGFLKALTITIGFEIEQAVVECRRVSNGEHLLATFKSTKQHYKEHNKLVFVQSIAYGAYVGAYLKIDGVGELEHIASIDNFTLDELQTAFSMISMFNTQELEQRSQKSFVVNSVKNHIGNINKKIERLEQLNKQAKTLGYMRDEISDFREDIEQLARKMNNLWGLW